jgi:ectoine hydroxylase-related dioxygenase (phytanoyl-CoA dioxygenase family)
MDYPQYEIVLLNVRPQPETLWSACVDFGDRGTSTSVYERSFFRRIKFFIWLTDVTKADGATGFVRGSSRYTASAAFTGKRVEAYRASLLESRRKAGANYSHAEPPWPFPEDVVYKTGPSGFGLVWLPFTLHANGYNESPRPRRILSIEFVQAGYKDRLSKGTVPVAAAVLSRQTSSFIARTTELFPFPGMPVGQ